MRVRPHSASHGGRCSNPRGREGRAFGPCVRFARTVQSVDGRSSDGGLDGSAVQADSGVRRPGIEARPELAKEGPTEAYAKPVAFDKLSMSNSYCSLNSAAQTPFNVWMAIGHGAYLSGGFTRLSCPPFILWRSTLGEIRCQRT